MSKKNIIFFSLAAQVYTGLIFIVSIPLASIYFNSNFLGLLGIYIFLRWMFDFFDFGLSKTIIKKTIDLRTNILNLQDYYNLFFFINFFYLLIIILNLIIIHFFGNFFIKNWFKYDYLVYIDIDYIIKIIFISASLNLLINLYKSILVGLEKYKFINLFNFFSTTLKFPLSIFLVGFYKIDIHFFFVSQFCLSVLEILFFKIFFFNYFCNYKKKFEKKINIFLIDFKKFISSLNFSSIIFLTSGIWILITSLDKILLSNKIILSDYGLFSSAVIFANVILFLNGPIGNIFIPTLVKLYNFDKIELRNKIYSEYTQILIIISGSIATTLFFFHQPLLEIIYKNSEEINYISKIFKLYIIGNFFALLSIMTFYLQFSIGKLNYLLKGHFLILIVNIIFLPIMINKFSVIGAGYSWILVNSIYFFIWTYIIHRNFLPNFHFSWIKKDIFPILFSQIIICIIFNNVIKIPLDASPLFKLSYISFVGLVVLITSSFCSSFIRPQILFFLKKRIT